MPYLQRFKALEYDMVGVNNRKVGLFIAPVAVVCCIVSEQAFSSVSFREPCPVPKVHKMSYDSAMEVRIDEKLSVAVSCEDSAVAVEWVCRHMKEWFAVRPVVSQGKEDFTDISDEGYRVKTEPGRIFITARNLQGVRYAMYSLRQTAEAVTEGMIVSAYRLPVLSFEDSPALKFRGLHLCWFPEVTPAFVEHMIRLAAYYKYNHLVIESWGVFQSEKHPWFSLKGGKMTKKELGRLVSVAKDVGITLVPQINIFGHAAAARIGGGKHITLDYHPERKSLFEPAGGWNWCLSNPAATAVLRDLVAEMHEAFGNPPFFHIGCDEAEKPSCASCRATKYSKLLFAHIASIHDLLKSRGARAMMWHDKLLNGKESKWKGYYAYGDDETSSLAKTLPRDIVICDWYYGKQVYETGEYPTADYFKSLGFQVVTSPWNDLSGIRVQAKYARENSLHGVLQTIWNEYRGGPFARMMETAACSAWGRGDSTSGWSALGFATHWRECGHDMGIDDYSETGYYSNQSTRDVLDY